MSNNLPAVRGKKTGTYITVTKVNQSVENLKK